MHFSGGTKPRITPTAYLAILETAPPEISQVTLGHVLVVWTAGSPDQPSIIEPGLARAFQRPRWIRGRGWQAHQTI